MMKVKIHRSYRNVVSLCDKNLIGKKFNEGKLQLDVRENFYNGDEMNHAEAKALLIRQAKEDASFNIVGEESIKLALETEIICEDDIGHVQGIPFALTLL